MKQIFAIASFACACAACAGVPVKWTVDTFRIKPLVYEAYHGETLDFAADLTAYGEPLDLSGKTARLYWQTNGMASAWWVTNAVVTSEGGATNVLAATLPGSSDTGAKAVTGFIGIEGENYRAAFTVNFKPSPGFTPNVLPLPIVSFDARLNGTPTINGTNLTEWVQARSQDEFDPLFSEWARTNEISSAGRVTPQVVTNTVEGIVPSWARQQTPPESMTANALVWTNSAVKTKDGTKSIGASEVGAVPNIGENGYIKIRDLFLNEITFGDNPGISIGGNWGVSITGNRQNGYGTTIDGVDVVAGLEGIGGSVNSLSNTVSAWQTYWDGDDVRVTVTNYYGSAGMPRLYIEEKMPTNETHASPWFKVVWDEMTRWTNFLSGYSMFTNNAMQNFADRAWGVYDSSTGAYSPDGLLQISQEQIMIASGLAYQKTVTTGGCAVWVLKATEPQTISGVSSNGFFRIEDGDGNALFEIVKGDKRTVGATASAIVANNGMTITYNVIAGEHPTLKLATDLNGTWYNETECSSFATVSWSGSSGAYVATLTPVGVQTKMFARATYVTGGETYIRNAAPISAAGGILCTDGIHKVRPVYNGGNITWEEVVP